MPTPTNHEAARRAAYQAFYAWLLTPRAQQEKKATTDGESVVAENTGGRCGGSPSD